VAVEEDACVFVNSCGPLAGLELDERAVLGTLLAFAPHVGHSDGFELPIGIAQTFDVPERVLHVVGVDKMRAMNAAAERFGVIRFDVDTWAALTVDAVIAAEEVGDVEHPNITVIVADSDPSVTVGVGDLSRRSDIGVPMVHRIVKGSHRGRIQLTDPPERG